MAIAFVCVLATCASDGDEAADPDTQPAPNATVFVDGHFDDIPLYPRSDAVSPRSSQRGTVTRSYQVDNAAAELIVKWYTDRLPEWQQVDAIETLGTDAYRARWSRDGYTLVISSSAAPTLSGDPDVGDKQTAQYNIQVTEPGGDVPGGQDPEDG